MEQLSLADLAKYYTGQPRLQPDQLLTQGPGLYQRGDDPVRELSAQRFNPVNAGELAMGIMGGPRLMGRTPYAGVPDSLMGFRRNGTTIPFEEQGWSHVQPVRVTLPNGDVFEDAVKGLNSKHALERARRNWEPGAIIEPISQPQAMSLSDLAKAYPPRE